MSELIQHNDNRATIRWKLLTGASALALAAYVSSADLAKAEDTSRPLIWLELDGQFAMQKNDLEIYNPSLPFLAASPFDAISHLGLEKTGPYVLDKSGKISFQPSGSDWVFSASIRYGKSSRHKSHDSLQTQGQPLYYLTHIYQGYQDFRPKSNESHAIVDFEVGKDVGLGRFGGNASSVLSAGVRFAQFHSGNHVSIASQPTNANANYNKFFASFDGKRSFEGIGPMLSWDASAMIAGNTDDGGISFDWGVNGAVLFGHQRMSEQHQTTKQHFLASQHYSTPTQTATSHARSKKVTVPNLGGFAAVSWRYADAKISFGYRVDYFFNVLDGGIATAQKENRSFYGPYASISIGLGD